MQAQDNNNVDDLEEAKESGGNKAVAGASDGSESNRAGNKSDIMVEMENKPVPKAKGKCKASESVRAAKGHKDGAKCIKVATGKPATEVKLAAKAVITKTYVKGKTPSKFPLKRK